MATKRSDKKKYHVTKLGKWAFLLGILVALISGIASPNTSQSPVVSLLIILGLLVGLLNITRKETTTFLLASLAFVIITFFGGNVLGQVIGIGPYLTGILAAMVIFIVPAAILVAIKTICIEEES
ncbi:MAG: hypothetical protein V1702_02265 [Candidatus Woesearchaeota archaeon]